MEGAAEAVRPRGEARGPSSAFSTVTVTDSISGSPFPSSRHVRNWKRSALSTRTSAPKVCADDSRPWPASTMTGCHSLQARPSGELRSKNEAA